MRLWFAIGGPKIVLISGTGNADFEGTITSGVISASGGVHTFSGGSSDYAATFSSTDAYSGIRFQDSDGAGVSLI